MDMFGSSGYRAIVDRDFMDVTFRFGCALGSMVPSALVGKDTRTSSDAVQHCLIAGLLASGVKTYDAGTVPTPTLAYRCREYSAGIMVTASHNPPEYNGLKPWNADGSAYDAHQRQTIENLVSRSSAPIASWGEIEALLPCPDAAEVHRQRVLKDVPEKARLKVVIDCGGGAGSVITPHLLQQMGCDVTAIHCSPTGFFPRNAEPTSASLDDLSCTVRTMGADVGLAHDIDADRLVATDENGCVIPGDTLMVLLAHQLGAKRVVTTVDASMAVEESGLSTIRTPVGDAFVSEEMKRGGDFGGEACGAWIFPGVSFCPDGIYAAAQVVRLAAKGKLSRQASAIPSYPIRRGSVAARKDAMPSIARLIAGLDPLAIDQKDGVRASFRDGWILIRPSGTEPKVRVTAEARTIEQVNNLYEAAISAVIRAAKEV